MKNLKTNQWVAVAVSVFVVGFFFVFGQTMVSFFNINKAKVNMVSAPQVLISNEVMGGGDVASSGDRVTVNYTGRFVNGKIFDSSVTRNEPFQFVLGVGQVIKGWDDGIAGMRVGGKRTLTVPSELGYGANDYGPIPGNSTLIFDVELLKVVK